MLYLDNAATTLKKPFEVKMAMAANSIYNNVNAGHGGHYYSLKGAKKIYESAEAISRLIGSKNPERTAFTYNATYAINMGIRGIISNKHIVTTCMDHNSVLRTVHSLGNYTMVEADNEGYVAPSDIEKAIREDTGLIAVTHASNVCGTILPIEEYAQIAKKHNIPILVDASQSIGVFDIDVEKMGIDMLCFSAHKGLMGPMGVGVLYVSENISLKPVITGGTGTESENLEQPRGLPDIIHSGTMNAPGIISCKNAVMYLEKRGVTDIREHELGLVKRFIENLSNMENVVVYGKKSSDCRNANVAFNIKGMTSTQTSELLNDKFGICTRGGWHCAYYAHRAIGSEKSGAVRASFGAFDSRRAVEKITDAVYNISKQR